MREHSEKLQTWLQSSDDILWIYGKAGSRKSTLMKFLFEHEQTRVHLDIGGRGKVTIAASFFWSAGSDLEKSHAGFLRALLYQILFQHPELTQAIFPERWKTLLRTPTQQRPWTEKELLVTLKLLSQAHTSNLRLFFLIDGLDEFSGDHHDLIESLQELNNSPAIKICVSSRPWIVFSAAYGSNVHCSMEIHELTVRDINIYVAARLESLRHHGVLTGEELKTLGNEVRARAEGVFLWVTLAIRDLRRGVGKRDSMSVLQKRLATYPSELHDFYQLILDTIDPVYRTFAGRLLLAMLFSDVPLNLIGLHLWEKYSCDTENFNDTQWCPKSGPELYQLQEQGESYARNWVGDLINPSLAVDVSVSCDSPDSCDCPIDEFIDEFIDGTSLSFSHGTVYQFVQQKADDGTLVQMAGPDFNPLLTGQYLLLGLSKYCRDLTDFAWVVNWALIQYSPPGRFEDTNNFESMIQIALAFDRIGQQITRPPHWTHWTISQLNEDGPLVPSDCQHSTLMSYMLMRDDRPKFWVEMLLDQQSHSITAGQRRFVLESAFNPGLYHGINGDYWPQKLVIELIKTLMDVNEPIRRVKCSLDYSIWQICLLWLHDGAHWALRDKDVNVIEVFQVFLSHGADPCAVVSVNDLERVGYGDECTLKENAAMISATELLEDSRARVCYSATDMEVVKTIDCAQSLLADATQCSSQHR